MFNDDADDNKNEFSDPQSEKVQVEISYLNSD